MRNLMRNRALGIGLLIAIVAIVLVGGAVALANSGDRDDDGDENFTGSVAAPQENGPEGSHDEAAEARSLQKLAKIDQSAAEKAALQAVPGTVENVRLEDENDSVVYGVTVKGDDGQIHHVDVDAGNGTVLQQELGADNDSDEGNGKAASR